MMLTLEDIKKSLLDDIIGYGFHIFWGAPHAFQGPTLHWNRLRQPEPESFLALAKAEGVNTLFVDWDVLAEKDLEWVQTMAASDVDSTSPVDADRLRSHLGKIGRITVGYFKDGVCHIYEQITDWFDELLKLEEEARQRGLE
jgi:hypothetical protein